MPLKPGQKKDLKVEIQKLKGLKELEEKLKNLISAMSGLNYGKFSLGSNLKKEFEALKDKVQSEIDITNIEIIKLKNTQTKNNPALDKIVKAIAKDCSQVIAEYRKTGLILLRGMKTAPTVFMGRSWNNRQPKDSNATAQLLYDSALKSMGFKALRSNSIFTTTDEEFASGYGEIYYIFPKNGFNYHWNKYIQDLILENITDIIDIDKIEKITIDVENWYYKTTKKDLNWIYEDPYEAAYDLKGFLKKLATLKYPKAKQVTVEKLININFVKKDVGATNTNFASGLKSMNEMVISGEYYAIDANSEVARYILNALKLNPLNY